MQTKISYAKLVYWLFTNCLAAFNILIGRSISRSEWLSCCSVIRSQLFWVRAWSSWPPVSSAQPPFLLLRNQWEPHSEASLTSPCHRNSHSTGYGCSMATRLDDLVLPASCLPDVTLFIRYAQCDSHSPGSAMGREVSPLKFSTAPHWEGWLAPQKIPHNRILRLGFLALLFSWLLSILMFPVLSTACPWAEAYENYVYFMSI